MQQIVFHLARAANGVIGRDGGLPWHIPADLKKFRAGTMGRAMVMGRTTFDSFARPLPGRRHIVLTRDAGWRAAGAEVAHTPADALGLAGEGEVAVIGGAQIFALYLPQATRIELTEVHAEPAGDATVPAFSTTDWREAARTGFPAERDTPAFSFVTLLRR